MCLECFKRFFRDKEVSILNVDGEKTQGSVWSDMGVPNFLSSWSLPKSEKQEFELKFVEYLALDEDPVDEPDEDSTSSTSSTSSQLLQ